MAKEIETIAVNEDKVACDGGDGPLGHPRVYLHMDEKGEVVCPYCSRKYVHRTAAEDAA